MKFIDSELKIGSLLFVRPGVKPTSDDFPGDLADLWPVLHEQLFMLSYEFDGFGLPFFLSQPRFRCQSLIK